MQQWHQFAVGYKDRAGTKIAEQFIDTVEGGLKFISESPLACSIYNPGEGYEDLAIYEFRKWPLKKFPYTIFFRITDNKTILIETMYSHRMDVTGRFSKDMLGYE